MSMSSSRIISLIPSGYLLTTRINGARDLAYLIATSWVPALWLLMRAAGLNPVHATLIFVAGYLAFISIYEIGYLANDVWDARRSRGGRRRAEFAAGRAYVALFLAIRIGLWVAIGLSTGWLENGAWLAGNAALAIIIAQHNLVDQKGLRIISFYGLATLRLLMPILALLPARSMAAAVLIAMIPYALPRLLAYMESKGLLELEQRRTARFGLLLQLSFVPLCSILAYWLDARVLLEVLVYFIVIHAIWWAAISGRVSDR